MASIRTLGAHPKDGEAILVRKGRFGPYVQHKQVVANLAKGQSMDEVTLDEALALLVEKGKPLKAKGKTTRKTTTKAAASESGEKAAPKKKAAPKSSTAKKPAVKKPASPRKKATATETETKPARKTRTAKTTDGEDAG